MKNYEILSNLMTTIEDRKSKPKESSYVASLMHKGLAKIMSKVEEEGNEVVEAAQEIISGATNEHLLYELADLFFHTMVLLGYKDITLEGVLTFEESSIETYQFGSISEVENKLTDNIKTIVVDTELNTTEGTLKIISDIFFYALVIGNFYELSIDDIQNELARREGVSGLVEKANRSKK